MKILTIACCLIVFGAIRDGSSSVATQDPWFKYDEYSNMPFRKEKRRLQEFVKQLRAQRTSTAYIVAYAGRRSCKGESQARADRVKRFLIRSGHIEGSRIRTIDAGYQEEWTIELYTAASNGPPLTAGLIKETHLLLPPDRVEILRNCKSKFSGVH